VIAKKPQCFVLEAEYKALANATSELIWVEALIQELGVFFKKRQCFLCDNLGDTYLSANRAFDARSKHIAIYYHLYVIELQTNF
jgi:hypothetical protein